MKTKNYRLCTFSTETDDDIVFITFLDNLKVDINIAKELVESRLEFTENKKHYTIIEMSNVKFLTHEARVYMQNPEGGLKNIIGAAFIASNPLSALLATIFIKTDKNFPAKFFSRKKDAFKWITELKLNAK